MLRRFESSSQVTRRWIQRGSGLRFISSVTPLGGREPPPPGFRPPKAKGGMSNARTAVRSRHLIKAALRRNRKRLDPVSFSGDSLRKAMSEGSPAVPAPRPSPAFEDRRDVVAEAETEQLQSNTVAVISEAPISQAGINHVEARLRVLSPTGTDDDSAGAPAAAVVPKMTIFADALDRFEQAQRLSRQEERRAMSTPFTLDEVYEPNALDETQDEPTGSLLTSSTTQSMEQRHAVRKTLRRAAYVDQHSMAHHRRLKAASREGFEGQRTSNAANTLRTAPRVNRLLGDADEPMISLLDSLPASENPHFPLMEATKGGDVTKSSANDYLPKSAKPSAAFDAFITRSHSNLLVQKRDEQYWDNPLNRERVDILQKRREEELHDFYLKESVLDTVRADHHSRLIRKETMIWYRTNPVNEMIQNSYVRINRIVPADGGDEIQFGSEEQLEVTLSEAKAMARDHGLDLVRTAEIQSPECPERGDIGVCAVADHRQLMRSMIRMKLLIKGGIQPPMTEGCVEVPFRGGIHPHGIRFKSIGVSKLLVRSIPVRITLTDFGSPREGFPVLQTILDEVKKQCLPLKAYHTCSPIQSNYDEIFCFLHPSTTKNPKISIQHPGDEELGAAQAERIMQNEKEMWFDDYYGQPTLRERNSYAAKLEEGTAWAEKDEGLSLKRQRDMKIMLGYLPKGNKELYAARGDVNIPFPFRTMHPTTTEKWNYPAESNLDQASRASAVLGKRYDMNIADMHARGETEDNPSVIDRFYHKMEGPALKVGEFKEALGLKSNRKKVPGLGPGWATLGTKNTMGQDPFTAAK